MLFTTKNLAQVFASCNFLWTVKTCNCLFHV